jgi:hypothetical protein
MTEDIILPDQLVKDAEITQDRRSPLRLCSTRQVRD